MRFETRLETKIGRDTGFRLPDGSLEKVYADVMQSLPERRFRRPESVSMWHRVRPYVYMAAMFAGIWCMMKVFHTATSPDISLDNPPALVAEVASRSYYPEEYSTESDLRDFELEQEVCDQYDDIEDFEKDFGYTLEPEYANAKVPVSSASSPARDVALRN